jgi:flagellar protein FlaG
MPIDHISQAGANTVRPVEPKRPVPAPVSGGSATRPVLPAGGENRPSEPANPADAATVSQVVSRLNDYVQTLRRDLVFRVDEETDKVVVTVVDPETGEVIRQIPSEEVMAVARVLGELQQGVLIDAKA